MQLKKYNTRVLKNQSKKNKSIKEESYKIVIKDLTDNFIEEIEKFNSKL